MPIGVGWQLGDNLLIQSKSWSLAIHALQLEAEDTILFVSLSGLALDELTSQYTVSMIDNAGKEYKLRDAIPLTSRDQLQVGALVLLPPTPEADELNLVIKQGDTAPLQMQIAKGTGPQEWRQRSGAVTLLFRKGYLDQSNYRISYNGASVTGDLTADSLSGKGMTADELLHNRATAAAKSTSQPGATPEIAPPRQFALALAGGEAIAHEMSWRVQDMAKNQVYYVYVIVTEGGNIKGTIVE
jgi:hypothetical protein